MRRSCLLVVTTLVIAGCGSKDPKTTTPATTPTSTTTTTTQKAAEPKGKLTTREYRSVRGVFTMLARIDGSADFRKVSRVLTRACRQADADTPLLAAFRADCIQTARVYANVVATRTRYAECNRAAQAGDISCAAGLFRAVGRSARVAGVRAGETNRMLRERAIRAPALGPLELRRASSPARARSCTTASAWRMRSRLTTRKASGVASIVCRRISMRCPVRRALA